MDPLSSSTDVFTWSAIITLWKRKSYLLEQLTAIKNQSIPPSEIIVIINERYIDETYVQAIAKNVSCEILLIRSDINSLYLRWSIAYIAKGQYINVFDDDTIPGEFWVQNAYKVSKLFNALVGSSGRIYNKNGFHNYFEVVRPHGKSITDRYRDCSQSDIHCDWVCNSYFFKRDWVSFILADPRYNSSQKTFDDIQLAVSLSNAGGIHSIVPAQPIDNKKLHGSLHESYGNDAHAVWRANPIVHFGSRKIYIESLISLGYPAIQSVDANL